jgi:hypothetical protein
MGILSDFFIAPAAPVPNYGDGVAFPPEHKLQLNNFTPLQAAQLYSVLLDTVYSVELLDHFPLLTPEDAEEWTMAVPTDMVQHLASIADDRVSPVAACFAEATSEELGWSREDFIPIVSALASLARHACETNSAMYLWNSL